MLEHYRRNVGDPRHSRIHDVDRATYKEFGRCMGWDNPPYFEECIPTLTGRAPVADAREKLMVKGLRLEPPQKERGPCER